MRTILIVILLFFNSYLFSQLAPIKVLVTDFNKNPLAGEQILFVEKKSNQTVKGVSNENGEFSVKLPKGHYQIRLKSVGEAQDYSEIEIPELPANAAYQEMWMEVMISEATSFTLDNLNFASGSSTILKSSYSELGELIAYLKLKPHIKIEIAGHTDSDGDDKANLTLSQKRAEAVKNYLVKNGISSKRLVAKGYGELHPIASNNSENGKALNRRTEIRMN